MPDGYVRVRLGEKRPVYGQLTAQSGTLTIAASPAPMLTLYDSAGAAVAGLADVTATGFNVGALPSPKVWYLLDTGSLAAGWYTLVFKLTATGSDAIVRIYEPSVEVEVGDVRG